MSTNKYFTLSLATSVTEKLKLLIIFLLFGSSTLGYLVILELQMSTTPCTVTSVTGHGLAQTNLVCSNLYRILTILEPSGWNIFRWVDLKDKVELWFPHFVDTRQWIVFGNFLFTLKLRFWKELSFGIYLIVEL